MTALRKRIKHVQLADHQLHARMDRVDRGTFELVVSDKIAPVRCALLYADTNREAIRKFRSYLQTNYPYSGETP